MEIEIVKLYNYLIISSHDIFVFHDRIVFFCLCCVPQVVVKCVHFAFGADEAEQLESRVMESWN